MASAAVLAPSDAPASGDDRPKRAALAAWAGLVAHVLGRVYRAFIVTLLLAAVLPTLVSWSSFVVRSGSMEPSISVGDVVVAKPFDAAEKVPIGRVVVFPNPAKPEERELLVHRVVEDLDNGEFATAGDANAGYDASTITSDDIDARATLLVPFIGRPMVWFADRDVVPLALWGAVTALAMALASSRSGRNRDGDGPRAGNMRPGRLHRGFGRTPRPLAVVPTLVLLVAGGIGLSHSDLASAGFTDTTVSPSNTWTVSDSLAHRLSLASPGAVVRGSVPLTATLSNTGAGDSYVVRMEYAVAGTSTWSTACTKSSAPYSCSWATDGVASRTYDLRAVATSDSTTLTSPVVSTILVDNMAPTVTMQNPGSPLSATVTFAATAADAHSGIARVVVQHSINGTSTYQDLCTDTTSPYSCQVDTATMTNGTYSLRAVATDVAGSSTTSAVITNRVIDNVATSVVMNDPGAIIRGTVSLTATASSTAGVASVRIQGSPAGANTWGDVCVDTSSPYACTYNTTAQPDGLYDLRAVVTDATGRTTSSPVVANRRVDNTAPRGSDVQTTNAGVTGRLESGDSISFTYTEQMLTSSISPGWDGSTVTVALRLRDGRLLGLNGTSDTVDVLRGGAPVNLGSVNLREDYINNNSTAQFNATMAASSVTVNGVQVTRVTISMGTLASGGNLRTTSIASTMSWTPSSSATDLGGLGTNVTAALESGVSDRQF